MEDLEELANDFEGELVRDRPYEPLPWLAGFLTGVAIPASAYFKHVLPQIKNTEYVNMGTIGMTAASITAGLLLGKLVERLFYKD